MFVVIMPFNAPFYHPMWHILWGSYMATFIWWLGLSLLQRKIQPHLSLAADAYIVGLLLLSLQYTGLEHWPILLLALLVPAVDVARWALMKGDEARMSAGGQQEDGCPKEECVNGRSHDTESKKDEPPFVYKPRYAKAVALLVVVALLWVVWFSIGHGLGEGYTVFTMILGAVFIMLGVCMSCSRKMGQEARLPVCLLGAACDVMVFAGGDQFCLATKIFILVLGLLMGIILSSDAMLNPMLHKLRIQQRKRRNKILAGLFKKRR